jgi:predicted nucleic acid-binding Zn ribbon protein
MKTESLEEGKKKKIVFKCFDCHQKFTSLGWLYNHIWAFHEDLIPEDCIDPKTGKKSVKRYYFNRKYKKTHGKCVVCGKVTEWNEDKVRYERYCSDYCVKKQRELFKKNCKRKLGTDNPAADPEHQRKALEGRSISGEYTFKDGGKVGYVGSYEKDFLQFLDENEEIGITSKDIQQCPINFDYIMDGEIKHHIPDFYIEEWKLIVQIKDGGDNPNMNSHIQSTGRLRQKLGDEAIVKTQMYNYIKIVNKVYGQFIELVQVLKSRKLASNVDNSVIIIIPE